MIGYYVHHHGRGHAARARSICAHLDEPVTFFSSLPRPAQMRPQDRWVQLPLDVPADGELPVDPESNGRLHWAPTHVAGLARRSADLLQVAADAGLRRLVVDVSVEIAMLGRLAGIPVTVMAMPGERTDPAHRLAYDIADQIVAPWSADVYRPAWLGEHAERTHFVGSISQFEHRGHRTGSGGGTAVLLGGAGGDDLPADAIDQLRAALPQYRWIALGASGWVDDPWPVLEAADVVITHAGQNAVADVALTDAAVIVIPQHRPFAEQHATAAALVRAGLTVEASAWPAGDRWPALLSATFALDRSAWSRLQVRGAAARAAQVIAA
ncbi:MAG: glycosyltransferase [Mycobacterium kyogaense]|uniref:glycosyltransferase n=1 Tax=Mycobacterium kyogaense TaxID=2212479 RepID=UPI002FFD1F0C